MWPIFLFCSKHKPGNAFVVARARGKQSTCRRFNYMKKKNQVVGKMYDQCFLFYLLCGTEVSADCYTTVAELCPFKKPSSQCPRCLHTPDIHTLQMQCSPPYTCGLATPRVDRDALQIACLLAGPLEALFDHHLSTDTNRQQIEAHGCHLMCFN